VHWGKRGEEGEKTTATEKLITDSVKKMAREEAETNIMVEREITVIQ